MLSSHQRLTVCAQPGVCLSIQTPLSLFVDRYTAGIRDLHLWPPNHAALPQPPSLHHDCAARVLDWNLELLLVVATTRRSKEACIRNEDAEVSECAQTIEAFHNQ